MNSKISVNWNQKKRPKICINTINSYHVINFSVIITCLLSPFIIPDIELCEADILVDCHPIRQPVQLGLWDSAVFPKRFRFFSGLNPHFYSDFGKSGNFSRKNGNYQVLLSASRRCNISGIELHAKDITPPLWDQVYKINK